MRFTLKGAESQTGAAQKEAKPAAPANEPSPSPDAPIKRSLSLKKDTRSDELPAADEEVDSGAKPPVTKPGLRLKGVDQPEDAKSPPVPDRSFDVPAHPEGGETPPPADPVAKLLTDLPFELPDRVGDELPPLPMVESQGKGRAGRALTFDDLEPAHSSKPPPPSDAPVFRGRMHRQKGTFGRTMVVLLACGLVMMVGYIIYAFFSGPDPSPVAEREAPNKEIPAEVAGQKVAVPAAQPTGTPTLPAPSNEEPERSEPAVRIEADPIIAAIVDNLTISIARPGSSSPMIIVDGVAYQADAIIDPDAGIRFVGFTPQRREAVFEDARGARYYRYF